MARPTKVRGMDVMPSGGVKIQKVGAIYTRTLEEGGAIYFENGVCIILYILYNIIYIYYIIYIMKINRKILW